MYRPLFSSKAGTTTSRQRYRVCVMLPRNLMKRKLRLLDNCRTLRMVWPFTMWIEM
ncbi:hypothetical protein CGRA01v4_14838 [Colletotrichum graminicola]|nr:hypothetical protein CGRA01v4_14838 [Colletotrichum graminicola]